MDFNPFIRTERLLGKPAMEKLSRSKVAIFGLGGVGGNCCEALARSGIGSFVLVDNDEVAESNLNRQLIATTQSIGMPKVDAMEQRILSINPKAKIEKKKAFYLPSNASEFDFASYDFCIDCIDTVTAKIDIVLRCKETGTPLISSMGAGNRLDPTALRLGDLFETKMDPLSKVMRRELRRRGITSLRVVYSLEAPTLPLDPIVEPGSKKRAIPGSNAFVPPVAGILIASDVVRQLIQEKDETLYL